MAANRVTQPLRRTLLFALFLLLLVQPCHAAELAGRIIGIADGDTVTLLAPDNQQVRVRLASIDAPEKAQPFGKKSRQMLSALVFGQDVRIVYTDTDRYGRIVGHIYRVEQHINLLMVSSGGAWAYRKYLGPDGDAFLDAEATARQNRLGLWALQDDQIMPPWEWRQRTRSKAAPSSFP